MTAGQPHKEKHMRFARKLVLLAVMALAALALSASTAMAQEDVEIQTEPGGDHCSEPCQIHVTSVTPSSLGAFVGETQVQVISSCTDEFLATLDEDGEGFIHTYENNKGQIGGEACTRQNCDDAGDDESEWDTHLSEAAGAGNANVRFCLETAPGAANVHCTANIAITEDVSVTHRYVFNAVNEHCGFVSPGVEVRLNGQWATENTSWELVH
jgi:hypothetical protein